MYNNTCISWTKLFFKYSLYSVSSGQKKTFRLTFLHESYHGTDVE